jgi:hypothetical protein
MYYQVMFWSVLVLAMLRHYASDHGPVQVVEQRIMVSEPRPFPAVLARIAKCESNAQQFYKNGKLVRGKVTPLDVGKYQINEALHYDAARSMGFDIMTEAGNEAFALYLYDTQGTEPWASSKKCWQ